MEKRIKIAQEYSRTPGGRWRSLGEYSGEDFYETMLHPRYLEAVESGADLIVELDGARSYPNSFLDQSFGELARKYGVQKVRNVIKFKTDRFSWIVDYINKEIWDKIS